MKKNRKAGIRGRMFSLAAMVMAATLILGLSLPVFAAESKTETKTLLLNFGATQSSSAYFPPRVVLGKIINKYVPEVKVTVMESGSTNDNALRVQEGIFQIGSGGLDTPRDQYWGEGKWKGKPWNKVRLLMGLSEGRLLTYVRRDANVTSWVGLSGKPLNPGFIGSDAEALTMKLLEATSEVKPKLVRGTMTDTMKSIRQGSIVGMVKQSPSRIYDSGMASVHFEIPLDIIGLNEKEKDRVTQRFPEISFALIKKGQFKEAPQAGDFWVVGSMNGQWVTNDLPEELVYKMVKAIYEHYDEVVASFAPAGWADPLKMMIEAAQGASPKAVCPVHAGVVRYLKEKGMAVPAALIPPEYKP